MPFISITLIIKAPNKCEGGDVFGAAGIIVADETYQQYLALNAQREVTRRFCRHDFQHMLDTARIAYILVMEAGEETWRDIFGRFKVSFTTGQAGSYTGIRELVYAAGLLHDIGRWHQYDTGEDHALAGARLAGEILERAGYAAGEREIITRAISEHRRGGQGASVLGRLLCRADDLSRPCQRCNVTQECYKYGQMEVAREGLLY